VSEKGGPLWRQIEESPERLMDVVTDMLPKPHQKLVQMKSGHQIYQAHDVFPETRLKTLVSIADRARSVEALRAVTAYSSEVIAHWGETRANFAEAVAVLRLLDNSKWSPLSADKIHGDLKAAVLRELAEGVGIEDIVAIVGYAEGKAVRWSGHDQARLVKVFELFLEEGFGEELGDCSTVSELEKLGDALEKIGAWCHVNLQFYQNEIDERREQLAEPEEDHDDRPVRAWDGKSTGPVTEQMQEQEVTRLFDGLA
jgi:hypothetical protein